MDLSRVTVLIKTLLRDGHLLETLQALYDRMPDIRVLVVDDGPQTLSKDKMYSTLKMLGGNVVVLPFDSGFGAKSNAAISEYRTEFVLIGSDDFDFRPARPGIERLLTVLDQDREFAVASGTVNGYPWQYYIDEVEPGHFEEVPLSREQRFPWRFIGPVCYTRAELTVNYSLIRTNVLGFGPGQVHWEQDVKIGGGEHGAFFLDLKRAGHRVAFVKDVNIQEQGWKPVDPRYGPMRRRAQSNARPCWERRGVKQWGSDYPK